MSSSPAHSTYQVLEADAQDLRQTLGARGAGSQGLAPYTGGQRLGGGRQWSLADLAVADTLSQVELGLDEQLFDFVPPPTDEQVLRRMRLDYRASSRTFNR